MAMREDQPNATGIVCEYRQFLNVLEPVGPEIWLVDGPSVSLFGLRFPTRMTVVRLGSGALWVHSPIQLNADLLARVRALGPVGYLIAPNKLHHLALPEWRRACPDARVYGSKGVIRKRSDVNFDGELGSAPQPDWAGAIEQMAFGGHWYLDEVMFLHRASRTLIVTDLIQNYAPGELSPVQRLLTRWARIQAPLGGTPLDLRLLTRDRAAARASVEQILRWRPERVILSHGRWVRAGAPAFLEQAFAWLDPQGPAAARGGAPTHAHPPDESSGTAASRMPQRGTPQRAS